MSHLASPYKSVSQTRIIIHGCLCFVKRELHKYVQFVKEEKRRRLFPVIFDNFAISSVKMTNTAPHIYARCIWLSVQGVHLMFHMYAHSVRPPLFCRPAGNSEAWCPPGWSLFSDTSRAAAQAALYAYSLFLCDRHSICCQTDTILIGFCLIFLSPLDFKGLKRYNKE